MGTAQSSPKMNGLLVLSTLAAASAQVVLPYGGLAGYPYGYAGYPYAVAKPVVNEGEAPRKRSADEEAAEAAPAAATVLPYHLGLGYHGLGYAGLGYPYAVAAPAPVEVEVPVTQYKYVPEVKTVELPPACQNAFGFAVPCA